MTTPSNIPFYQLFLNNVPPFYEKMTLGPLSDLLSRLGNPQDQLKTIHIAGTNGKGSSCKILSSIYTQAGLKVGTYTSPYILDYRETITLNEEIISQSLMDICALEVHKVYELMKTESIDLPTQYECITAIAFLAMKKSNMDLCVIETLMGGKNDATNVLKKPLATLITSISLDHTEYLGTSIEEITTHKAGIIKKNCPAVFNKNPENVLTILTHTAEINNSPIYFANSKKELSSDLKKIFPLKGEHQLDNLMGCLKVIEILNTNIQVTKDHIAKGLANIEHPCRLEFIQRNHRNFLFDGGHNREGIDALYNYLVSEIVHKYNIKAIYGSLKDKDYTYAIGKIQPLTQAFIMIKPLSERGLNPNDLKDQTNISYDSNLSIYETFDQLKSSLKSNELLLVFGSFYISYPLRQYLMDD